MGKNIQQSVATVPGRLVVQTWRSTNFGAFLEAG
jgi:hypothetical protein